MNMNDSDLRIAWRCAEAMALRRPDYVVNAVSGVMEHDGVRLVPGPKLPVPFDLAVPLIVLGVSQEFGLTSITVGPREVMVDDIMFDIEPESNIKTFRETLVYDDGYPILIR